MSEGSTDNQTEWNGGTLTNIRIDRILIELKESINSRDLSGVLSNIIDLNTELYGFEKESQQKDLRNRILKISEKINQFVSTTNNKHSKVSGVPADLMDEIYDIRYQLYKVFHDSNLQTSLREGAEDAF